MKAIKSHPTGHTRPPIYGETVVSNEQTATHKKSKRSDIYKKLCRRPGIIAIQQIIIETEPELVMEVLSKLLILRAEHFVMREFILYEALSEYFDQIDYGTVPPRYVAFVTKKKDGEHEIHFIRNDEVINSGMLNADNLVLHTSESHIY
jgi:hypothetical protein